MPKRQESWMRNTEALVTVAAIVVILIAYGVARLLGLAS